MTPHALNLGVFTCSSRKPVQKVQYRLRWIKDGRTSHLYNSLQAASGGRPFCQLRGRGVKHSRQRTNQGVEQSDTFNMAEFRKLEFEELPAHMRSTLCRELPSKGLLWPTSKSVFTYPKFLLRARCAASASCPEVIEFVSTWGASRHQVSENALMETFDSSLPPGG